MSEEDDSKPHAIGKYVRDATMLDAERFAKRNGDAFLVHSHLDALQAPAGPQRTMNLGVRGETTGPASFRVWPIRKSSRSIPGTLISVGRTPNNDVVIPDVSLSKFHAIFLFDGAAISLRDGRSRNGTFVDGHRVAPQGEGPPTRLASGATIRFGAVDVTFLDAAGLQRLVLTVAPKR